MKVFVLAFFFPVLAFAQMPFIDTPIKNIRTLEAVSLDEIGKILASARLARHLQCKIETRMIKEERTFTTGKRLVESLEVTYYPGGFFSSTKFSFTLPAGFTTFGKRLVASQYHSVGEEFRIEVKDRLGHRLTFIHDGKGQIVFLGAGNDLADYPCYARD